MGVNCDLCGRVTKNYFKHKKPVVCGVCTWKQGKRKRKEKTTVLKQINKEIFTTRDYALQANITIRKALRSLRLLEEDKEIEFLGVQHLGQKGLASYWRKY